MSLNNDEHRGARQYFLRRGTADRSHHQFPSVSYQSGRRSMFNPLSPPAAISFDERACRSSREDFSDDIYKMRQQYTTLPQAVSWGTGQQIETRQQVRARLQQPYSGSENRAPPEQARSVGDMETNLHGFTGGVTSRFLITYVRRNIGYI
ncbi:hypothetical protein M758_UG024200 [Ceratodon purpureus]|nr:hypothetical protein M758_UG024200 [Ceratodon purpureus]